MICLIAGNHEEARTWASGQGLDKDEWFYPEDIDDIQMRANFHVIVVGTAGQNVTPYYFEKVFHTAKTRGKIGRR